MAGPWTKEWWKRQEEASKKRSGAVGAWDRDKAKHDAKAKADAEAESRARAEAVGFEWEPRNPNAEARAAADARYRAAADARVRAVADARVRAEAEADAQARAEAERKAKEEARVRSWEEAAGAGARARADEEAEARADAEAATVLGLQPDEDDEDTEIHTKKKKEPDPLFGVDRYAVPDSTATPPVGQDELDPGLDVGRVTPPDRPPTPRVDQDEVDEALLLGQYTSPDRTPTPRVDQDEVDPGLDVGRVTPLGVKDEPVLPVAQPTAPVLPMAQSTALVLQMAQPTTSVVPTAVPHEEIPLQAFLDAGTVFLNNQPTDVKSLIRPRKVHAPYVYGSMEEYEAEKEKTKQEAKWAAQTYLNARMRDGSLSFLELPPQSQISKEDLGDKFLIDGVPTNTKAYFDARFEDYLRKNRLSDNPRWVSDEGVKVLRDKNDAIAMLDVNEARQDGRVRLLGESWVPDAPDIYLRHEQGHVNPLEFSSVYTAIQSKLDARDRGGPGGVLITGPEDERIDEAAELVPLDMLVGPGGTWFRQGVQTAKRTRRYVAGLRGTRGLTPTQDVIASTLKTTPFKDILRAEQIQARRAAFAHESDFMQPPVPSQRRYVDITIDGQKQRIDMGPEWLQHIYRDPLDPDQAIYLKQPPRGQITTRPNVASAPREGFLDRRVVDAIKMQEVIDPATQIQRSLSVASAPKRGFLGRLLRRRAVDPSDPTGQSEAIIKIGDKTYMVHPDQRPALRGMIPLLEGFPTSREGSIARIIRIHRTYRGARRVKTPGGKPGQWTIEEFTQPGYVEMEIDGKVHRFLRDPLDVRLPGKGTYAIEKPPSDIQDFTMDWSQWRGQGGPGTKPSSGPTVADEITELHAPTSASSPKLITSETPGKGTELWLPASGVDVALDAGRAQLHTPSVRSIETQAEPGIWPMSPETVPANTGAQTDVTTDVDEALLLGQYTPAEGTGVKTDTEPRPYVIPHFTGPETVPTTPVKTDTEPRPYVIPHFTGPEDSTDNPCKD